MRTFLWIAGWFAVVLSLPLLLLLWERYQGRGWSRVARELGLQFKRRRLARSLRGELNGVRLELVWSRRLDATGTLVAAGDSVAVSTASSGAVLTARPADGARLDVERLRQRLAGLEERGPLRVSEELVRWAPRGAFSWSAAVLERTLRAVADEVREAVRADS